MSIVIDSVWFNTARGCIGIVLVKPDFGDKKAYVGIVDGLDKTEDEKYLAEHGTHFPAALAEALITGDHR